MLSSASAVASQQVLNLFPSDVFPPKARRQSSSHECFIPTNISGRYSDNITAVIVTNANRMVCLSHRSSRALSKHVGSRDIVTKKWVAAALNVVSASTDGKAAFPRVAVQIVEKSRIIDISASGLTATISLRLEQTFTSQHWDESSDIPQRPNKWETPAPKSPLRGFSTKVFAHMAPTIMMGVLFRSKSEDDGDITTTQFIALEALELVLLFSVRFQTEQHFPAYDPPTLYRYTDASSVRVSIDFGPAETPSHNVIAEMGTSNSDTTKGVLLLQEMMSTRHGGDFFLTSVMKDVTALCYSSLDKSRPAGARSVLLNGPRACGKTSLLHCAKESIYRHLLQRGDRDDGFLIAVADVALIALTPQSASILSGDGDGGDANSRIKSAADQLLRLLSAHRCLSTTVGGAFHITGLSESTPVALFIDNIDALGNSKGDIVARAISRLLDCASELTSTWRLCVILTTGSSGGLGFSVGADKSIDIPRPNLDSRRRIIEQSLRESAIDLENVLSPGDSSCDDVDNTRVWARKLAALSNGYMLGDVSSLLQEVLTSTGTASCGVGDSRPALEWSRARSIAAAFRPLLARHSPDLDHSLCWDDFAGYTDVKKSLQRIFSLHKKLGDGKTLAAFPDMLRYITKGVVVSGPSGVGKTHLCRVIAAESGMNLIACRSTELLSKYFSETEARVRSLFKRARSLRPCVLFFDEFDAIAVRRRGGDDDDGTCGLYNRILSTFLNEIDGISTPRDTEEGGVIVLAACSDLSRVDEALLRAGRLQHHVQLHHPSPEDLRCIVNHHLKKMSPLLSSIDSDFIAAGVCTAFEGGGRSTTTAEVSELFRRAKLEAMRHRIESGSAADEGSVALQDFLAAIGQIRAVDERESSSDVAFPQPFTMDPSAAFTMGLV